MTPDELAKHGLRVKPLEWHNQVVGFTCSPSGYSIMESVNRVYGVPGEYDGAAEFQTLELAQAAATADYAARIAAALEPIAGEAP